MEQERLAIAIPTFRRAGLLGRLLGDLAQQSLRPERLIVVDGENGSTAVRRVVEASGWPARAETSIIGSTRANLPFQRMIARRAAGRQGVVLYLDDDLRIPSPESVCEVVAALQESPLDVVAATAEIAGVTPSHVLPAAARLWGSARLSPPGGLTPTGVRVAAADGPRPEVSWLRGGVMAIRADVLARVEIPDALLALAERGWGLGEDLVLGLLLTRHGRIVLARRARFDHPSQPNSTAYRRDGTAYGFGCAYSRRLVNDYYRGDRTPHLADRLSLIRTYAGATALNCWRAVANGAGGDFAVGYALGACSGMLRPPTASRLTPGIDWADELRRSAAQEQRLS